MILAHFTPKLLVSRWPASCVQVCIHLFTPIPLSCQGNVTPVTCSELFLITCSWSLVPGHLFLVTCFRTLVPGLLFLVTCSCPLVPDHLFLVTCSWPLVPAHLFLITCSWLLVPGHLFLTTSACSLVPDHLFLTICSWSLVPSTCSWSLIRSKICYLPDLHQFSLFCTFKFHIVFAGRLTEDDPPPHCSVET
jgi:hypothetical protein